MRLKHSTFVNPQFYFGPELKQRQREALPQLQSFVIVLLKVVLSNLALIPPISQQPTQQASNPQPGFGGEKTQEDDFPSMGPLGDALGPDGVPTLAKEEIDKLRAREIANKAISTILLVLLKWLRVSRESRLSDVLSS